MAHSLRAATLAGALALAALGVRCEPQTFDLLPEYGAGTAGSSATGGKNNSSGDGTDSGGGGNTGRTSGGKSPGGESGGGGASIGGFGPLAGGRSNQTSGGFAGRPADLPPQDCSQYCGGEACQRCTPPAPNSGDNGGCPPSLVCPSANNSFAQRCPVCVACASSDDCKAPLTTCDDNKTCTRQCGIDSECRSVPNRPYCENGLCTECKNQQKELCSAPRPFCANGGACVECLGSGDCDTNPLRRACDFGVCKECTRDSDCQFTFQSPGGWCARSVCFCNDNDQCKGSPFGSWCILGHCRACGPQQPCPSGEICDLTGQCQH